MAITEDEKDWEQNNPVGVAANRAEHREAEAKERSDSDSSPDEVEFEKHENFEKQESKILATAIRTQTTSTEITTSSDKTTEPETQKKLPWSKRLNPLKRNPPPVPTERQPSREYSANFFSKLTFQWISPLMSVGYSRPLEVNDLYAVNPNRSAHILSEQLITSFNKRHARGDKRPLLGAMYDTLKVEFIVGGICQLISSVVQVISPFLLRYLIAFAADAYAAKRQGRPQPPLGRGVGLVFAIFILAICQTTCTNQFMYRGMMNGGQARAMLMAVIFDKAMRLSGRAKAGGKAVLEKPPPEVKPGSEEEKKWYKKILKRKKKEAGLPIKDGKAMSGDGRGWSNGRIINLMSVDTWRIDQASGMFHMIWCSPIQILITLALLIINLTYSALAGFGLLVIAMPILAHAIRRLFKHRVAINKITDQRVTLTQEILQAVRFVKFFGWETAFLNRIYAIRKREIRSIQRLLTLRNAINAVSMSMPVFASMLAFITYSLSKHVLNPAPIFSSLALFNALRMPLNFLPLVLGQVIDALASVRRIQEFLLEEEAADDFDWDFENKNAIVVEHANFTWERTPTQDPENVPGKDAKGYKEMKQDKKAEKKSAKEAKKAEKRASKQAEEAKEGQGGTESDQSTLAEQEIFKLWDIDFSISRNELIAVIGTVGSGKSSLLAALAGDMRKTSGTIRMGASRAFCPQYAWIQNATAKENIMFGKPFKRDWYDKVVEACALLPDFEMLPHADLTEIGERGITVSGGQKQRLNIARAIYFDTDIVLLDDPLSAVDAHVGRHIMDKAICGLLKDKCRILATHQLWVLNRCDRIIWMEGGRIQAIDTFDNLMGNNDEFVRLMKTTAVEEKGDEEEHENEIEEKKGQDKGKAKKRGVALMTIEERQVESVKWRVYGAYAKAGGGYWIVPLVGVLLVSSQISNIITSLWLSWWTSNKYNLNEGSYVAIYACLGVVQALMMFLFSVSLSIFGTIASKVMLHNAMYRVLRAPISFFDTTPLGRITNRFSKDIDTMDNNLTDSYRMYFLTLGMILAVFILIIVYFHYFVVALGPLFIMFIFSAAYYRASAREIKRLEANLRSFVFAKYSEAVSGVATIRAYGLQKQFMDNIREAIDDMNSAYFLTFANQRWLSVRLDVIGNLLIFTVGILVVTARFTINPSIGGLVLSYILSIVQIIQFTVRQLAELENNMNSTERIHYYGTELEEEAPLKLTDIPKSWPENGEIVFNNVDMRYRSNLPLVLQGLTLHVKAGERIGIVGRTGAGKSSIMTTLFRMVEISGGQISIDGIDISKIGLADLRSKLSIIPQDPTLFRGTIRSNLDPFNEHTDLELWSALRQADLVSEETPIDPDLEKKGRIHLDSVVEEEGLNFSLGQRQLMALARALVRGSQIIVCDEATSSVDMETDQKIQKTMQTAFGGRTLLCIAHRLRTIIRYDRIVVMDAGRIVELDTPIALFERGGIFRGMCDRSGITKENFFEDIV